MDKTNYYSLVLSGIIIFLSSCAFLINFLVYNYPANNYFPFNTIHIGLSLVLFYLGLIILVGKDKRISKTGLELIYFFLIMCLIALATNAVQLTPFPPIDQSIVAFEASIHINLMSGVHWLNQHPKIYDVLGFIYDSLTYQMCFIPLLVIAMGRFHLLKDYYFLLILTTLIGFVFYYFFPTTAPASVFHNSLFTPYQIATGLKFKQIHNHIAPTTMEGGLIALPSFHTIWALLCVYLLKEWPFACGFLLLINTLLVISCILLGWHYPSDIVAALLLIAISYYFLRLTKHPF